MPSPEKAGPKATDGDQTNSSRGKFHLRCVGVKNTCTLTPFSVHVSDPTIKT